MYSGREARLYAPSEKRRCTRCTNAVTGEKLLSNCPDCHGTGWFGGWNRIGDFWTMVDFGPRFKMDTPIGNTENPGGQKDQIVILGAPILHDEALIIFLESREVHKIWNVEPSIIALRGDVVAQMAQASRVTPGSPEYKLIDW